MSSEPPPRKLTRSSRYKMIAGVCGGIAEYFQLDPTIVRVLFIALTVLGGAGVVLYLAMWILVPSQP